MLILSRRVGESRIIDGGIKVTVMEVSGLQVRIGVDAPKDVTVDREEIHQKKVDGKWDHNRKSPGGNH